MSLWEKLPMGKKKLAGAASRVISITNNLLATTPGTALDAVQGKILDDKIEEVNNNLVSGFIDTNNEIVSKTAYDKQANFSYTATENCKIYIQAKTDSSVGENDVFIDNKWVGIIARSEYNVGQFYMLSFLLKKGQTISTKGVTCYAVYKIK